MRKDVLLREDLVREPGSRLFNCGISATAKAAAGLPHSTHAGEGLAPKIGAGTG